MAFTNEQAEELGLCTQCLGRGSWLDKGEIKYCEACEGTGLEPEDGDVD